MKFDGETRNFAVEKDRENLGLESPFRFFSKWDWQICALFANSRDLCQLGWQFVSKLLPRLCTFLLNFANLCHFG